MKISNLQTHSKKMTHRTVHLVYLWILIYSIPFRCYGHPHNLLSSDATNNYYNGEAIKRLLRVFGLDGNVPQHRDRSSSLPPQYMLDLYKFYSDNSFTEKKFRYSKANTVRSFFDKGSSDNTNSYHFDLLDSIPKREEVVEAEFHFFTNRSTPRLPHSSYVIQIQLYEGSGDEYSKLLHARMVNAHSSGWEVFKVTSSVKKWISETELNSGLSVKVLDSAGREWSSRRVNRLQNYRKPILIVFSRDPKTTKQTKLRNTQYSLSHQTIVNTNKNSSESSITRSARSASISDNSLCMRHELRVDFDKLGWSTWIISPKWYDAYICAGTCAFPLGQNQRPTNHATVQSIVHELGLTEGVGAPCCVPTELHPVSLLYFDEHNNVVLKQYDDMVAAGCGCQ